MSSVSFAFTFAISERADLIPLEDIRDDFPSILVELGACSNAAIKITLKVNGPLERARGSDMN